MNISVKQLFNIIGERKDFQCQIPVEELDYLRGFKFSSPVDISGFLFNRAGIVSLEFSVRFTLTVVCDRCLDELDRDYFYEFEHTVVHSLENDNDEYIIAQDDMIDINEIALSDLLLQLPSKMLCCEECKGLCPVCGCNLNKSECECNN